MHAFRYRYDAGPFLTPTELAGAWDEGNCRRAVQYYLHERSGVFLAPEQVLCPAGYDSTGVFVTGHDRPFSFESLCDGDVMYLEKIRGKDGRPVDATAGTFPTRDEYIIALHTALFTGIPGAEIWHATAIVGRSCTWDIPTLLSYYKPIAAKRIASS